MSNRLALETSPYLLQHKDNAVDWYPWGPEALTRARAEQKPIFLSIGYSACHWCHVMEHESFENPEIGAFLNARFISIKVDREERPDLDQIYMNAVQIMTRHGGWPMSVFLTPDLQPFYGGTYWPPYPRMGMPGFIQVLQAIDELWRTRREDAVAAGGAADAVPAAIGSGRSGSSRPSTSDCSRGPWSDCNAISTRSTGASASNPSSRTPWRCNSCCGCGGGPAGTACCRWCG